MKADQRVSNKKGLQRQKGLNKEKTKSEHKKYKSNKNPLSSTSESLSIAGRTAHKWYRAVTPHVRPQVIVLHKKSICDFLLVSALKGLKNRG